jgi:hypothetical protein
MASHLTKGQWIALLKEQGLTDNDLQRWHQLFEQRHPLAHQSFLSWLGLTEDDVATIRQQSC